MPDTILDFGAPPVIEVVVSVRFDPLQELHVPHYGLFWNEVRAEFPTSEHASPLANVGTIALDAVTGVPIPRVWLISRSGNELIQLQSDAFIFNWRQVEDGDNAYPRFSHVVAQFQRFFDLWKSFVHRELGAELRLTASELSYINTIPKGEGWKSWGELGELFPDFVWRKDQRFLPPPSQLSFQLSFPIEGARDRLIVRLNPAIRKKDKVELVRLELVAHSDVDVGDDPRLDDWLKLGREWIVKGFADITSEDVQKTVWLREAIHA